MAKSGFTGHTAQKEVAAAIREIEQTTSAEIVVAVRPSAGFYRHTDYLVGFALSFAALLVFLFDPHEFSIAWMPVDTLAAFVVGTLLSAGVPPLRRALTSRKLMANHVRTAARASFVDLGISRTSGRSGILVFASMFERQVEVVTDIGIDRAVLGTSFEDGIASLKRAVRRGPNFPAFVSALRALGPILANALPRLATDVNELPDEPPA
jgi:putative membrane protein